MVHPGQASSNAREVTLLALRTRSTGKNDRIRFNATANRTLEVLRAILRKCVDEWEWLDRAPKVRMLKEPVRRIRYLRREEADRLIAALPEHLAAMARFSPAT
jgi:integrase